jgi:epoxyqueuosine reductase QueG
MLPLGSDELVRFCRDRGAVAFGVADLSGVQTDDFLLPPAVLRRLPIALTLAMPVLDTVLSTLESGPNLLYEHHYRQVNFALDRLSLDLAAVLARHGRNALPIPASQLVDWQNQRGHLSHKRLAVAAGIGWLGRNNLLVTPGYGARVRLVSLLTDLDLEPGSPIPFGCAGCRECIAACPAGAIKDTPEQFDHHACFAALKEFQRKRLVSQYICGLCVRACIGRPSANT